MQSNRSLSFYASEWLNRWRTFRLSREVKIHANPDRYLPPVVFFIASARLYGLSQNATFSMLTSWGLRLAGIPVKYFVCQSGMSPCVLGTNRKNYHASPPCNACIRQSQRMYAHGEVEWFTFNLSAALEEAIKHLNISQLSNFKFPFPTQKTKDEEGNIPLGQLVLPSIRWALRIHNLPDDEPTRYLMRAYIQSAYNVAISFHKFIEETKPAMAVIFNGIMYPEASARWVALTHGVKVITHEVGFQKYSAFFTQGEATAYPIHIPPEFELSATQNRQLDTYLANRFQGDFTMAGIRFWPEMRSLDDHLLNRIEKARQLVSIFTNVIYDTSQVHANKVFPHMFAWLAELREAIRANPDTLFVIRAHPDEMRPGTAKQSRESVSEWVQKNGIKDFENVVFIDSQEYVSSYELIQRSKFILVYNSSIGLEAALMGKPVLCAGKARYTQYPIVFFPETQEAFKETLDSFLNSESIHVPPKYIQNARKFLYFQLYKTSLSFTDYVEEFPRKGFVKLRHFSYKKLLPENSITMRTLTEKLSQIAYSDEHHLQEHEITLTIPEKANIQRSAS